MTLIIDRFIRSVMSLYRRTDYNYYLRFHDGFITLPEVCELLVPDIGATNWVLDKEELARVWHNVILLPVGRAPEEFLQALPPPHFVGICTSSPTDPKHLTEGTSNLPVELPILDNIGVVPVPPIQRPTHEVKLTTVWSDWFMDEDDYFIRFKISKQCKLARLVINQTEVGALDFRYNVTWLPHYHTLSILVDPGMENLPPVVRREPIICKSQTYYGRELNVTCQIWNVKKSGLGFLQTSFTNMKREDRTMMAILTGSDLGSTVPSTFGKSIGYGGTIFVDGIGNRGGVIILWKPDLINLTVVELNNLRLHVTVETAEAVQSITGNASYFIESR